MEAANDSNALIDHVEFHIVPSQNRYDTWVCSGNKKVKVTSGLLEHLLLHSAEIKALHSKGSSSKYKLCPPENSHDIKWFTKSTLIRFLHIIGPANILEVTNSLKNEISQLEEARKFHLSLYAKGGEYQLQSEESDGNLSGTGSIIKAEGSDASKNELLRAMDLRLSTLIGELITVFDQAAGSRYSVEEIADIEKFSQHFGSRDLSDSLRKLIELRQGAQAVENLSSEQFLESDRVRSQEGNKHATKSLFSETQVKYGVSPAKAAQVERQSSTESNESSFSSEEEQPSAERSRTLARSASPRRSASPMRRVQIGRSGSRRSTAITIKSLNYYPARDKTFLPKDPAENDSDEEGSEQAPPKKAENNARRMSVQDAINLFESKQRDQTVDIQKARSLLNASIGATKSVLRRWSSGMGEDSSQCPEDNSAEEAITKIQNNVDSRETACSSQEPEAENGSDVKLDGPEKGACGPVVMQEETLPTESTDVSEKLIASAEWSRQKEAELNELLMKMMETKPVKSQNVVPASSKRQSLPSEQRGGIYDHYKEKRDEKLLGEAARKRVEKDKQFKAMQQILDAKKSQLTSAKPCDDAGKKHNAKKVQKPQKSASQIANPKTESPKIGIVKKASPKASSLPPTRKSWPSLPPPRATEPSHTKPTVSTSSTSAVPTRRRSTPTPPVSHSTPKIDKSQIRVKSVKSNENGSKKISATEKHQQSVTKPKGTDKSKVQTAPEDLASAAKPSLYSKVTKKSSVVPLESKPFLRKGSGTTSGVNPAVKKKASCPQETLTKSEDMTLVDENVTAFSSFDQVIQHEEKEIEKLNIDTCTESETVARSPKKCQENEGVNQDNPTNPVTDEGIVTVDPELKSEAEEESTISPTAWVEIEEHEDHSDPPGDRTCETVGSKAYIAPAGVSSPRVRHSLSQMLLEESSEPDVGDWGNAENPPPMAFQKDAPKGLKRLLKFARKSKHEANASGWSSPSVFSEGEDDVEDSKVVNKRSSENLLRKATLHSRNNGNQKYSTDYEHPGQANISKLSAQSLSQQFQDGHVSASVTTAKATRSFFSLSAFKGSK